MTANTPIARPPNLTDRGTCCLLVAATISLQAVCGCAISVPNWGGRGWVADYESAEKQVRRSGGELLVYFKRTSPGTADQMSDALENSRVKQLTSGDVRCLLSPTYEPDRRFVAQYGVERAPALIVVHADGTYHAHTGVMNGPDIVRFLVDAVEPGSKPKINPHIPRTVGYSWLRSLAAAKLEAQRTGKPMLIVLDRWPSRGWHRLEEMLNRREVYSRLADMIHCKPGSLLRSAQSSATLFGVDNLPALVIAHADGNYSTLELPMSYEAIVRFADEARRIGSAGALDERANRRQRSPDETRASAGGP